MTEYKIRPAADITLSDIAHGLERYLKEEEHMDTRVYHHPEGYDVHGRIRRGDAKMIFGMDKTIAVHLEPCADGCIAVRMGYGVWKDKLAAGAASVLIMWPLAVTAICGALRQQLIFDKVKRAITALAENRVVQSY